MPFDPNPAAMPAPPDGWDDSGLMAGYQAECVWGVFDDMFRNTISMATGNKGRKAIQSPITAFASGGMTACSAVFLRFQSLGGRTVGAVIHFDSVGSPGQVFRRILKKYNMDTLMGRLACTVTLVTHYNVDQTGRMAYNDLVNSGLPAPQQFAHNGSACMDELGNVFDHYED